MSEQKIKSPEDLDRIKAKILADQERYTARVLICMTGCRALGAVDVASAFRDELKHSSLDKDVAIVETGCIGLCAGAPVVLIEPYEYLYSHVRPEDVSEIIETTIKNGKPVNSLAVTENNTPLPRLEEIPFYNKQNRAILENCGRIDPKRIEDSIARGGYGAAVEALLTKTPQEIIEQVVSSGLRGRGGAGFPTGLKWGFCRKSPGDEKYLICNADEGDPGAFMDRAVLEGDPHRVIEGMIIAAYAIGATHGFIYVRAEYPIAVEHINLALDQARNHGLLGDDIAGSGFAFDVEVRMGAGRGMPSPRPPFPAEKGYQGKPTNINNVETFANVSLILKHGAQWYRSIGTEGSKGTKIFALAGKVNNTGLVEVPMGATLREIVFDIGAGIPKGRKFKAAQMGGPSGGCVPARFLDLPIDYDSVKDIGAIMGSGGLIVMDETTCMVDIARYFLEFVQSESCGKCTPCRVGTKQMLNILENICEGKADLEDLDRLEKLANSVAKASLCGLGQTAPNPVLSTLRYFRDEYEEHIIERRCRASVCEALVDVPCSHACPAGVDIPEYVTLIAQGKIDDAVNVIRRRNPFVSVCGRVCDHPCERRCRRSDVDEPLAIRALKRYASDHTKIPDQPLVAPVKDEAEVAIIGSGPAGLSCGYFLALFGRASVVFESQPVPGGMLALGIPEYRLPKRELEKDIDFILAHGVRLETDHPIDDAPGLLERGYRAVFVATGAQKSRKLGIEGEKLEGVVDSLEFLRNRGLGRQVSCGTNVTVIGGGNAAVDAARTAWRLGAKKVCILYRRSREEMPAYEEEIEAALEEGVELMTLVAPKHLIGSNGKVAGVELQRMELGPADESGRRRPIAVAGTEFVVPSDMVLPAVGQLASLESLASRNETDLRSARGARIHPVSCATSVPAIFAGGDCVTGGSTVIEAIGHGQRAAIAIDRFLGGPGVLPPATGLTYSRPDEDDLQAGPPRAREQMLAIENRAGNFDEVALGLEESAAQCEAGRCLRCDLERQRT